MRDQAQDAAAGLPQGPPRYPVSPETHYRDANWQHFIAPPAAPQTLGDLPRQRYGSTGLAPLGQLVLALALMAPSWCIIQLSLTVDYDGLLSLVGLALSGLVVAAVAIVSLVVLGLPVRLIPWVNRRWAGNARAYVAVSAIAVGLMTAGCLMRVPHVGGENGIHYSVLTPDPVLLCGGWFLLAFLMVNASLPLRWTR
ncbi:hypothetical protein SAMN04489743_3445 [Pseudarthrobacter equi]|uniref:Uncharacterized protein n=1 Tax=Pseudarthrobacter equi TaxID=728066 RepID=A0A1H2B5E0_9MICC|nr:hypothetical protein [Pseudarthrobacter equi]SDT53495.1 hypothetical protein SAMN04489743_3445 [Pseudarthrobacter equi]